MLGTNRLTYVVKSECPQQFVSGGSFADDGQELHEVAESYATSTIPEIILDSERWPPWSC